MQTAGPSPTTEAEWKRALALVHPDLPERSDDGTEFRALIKARDAWRKTRLRLCIHCGRVLHHPREGKVHCNRYCANQTIAFNRRKQRAIKLRHVPIVEIETPTLPKVVISAEVFHARHENIFGPFGRCRHTVCFRARHPERHPA